MTRENLSDFIRAIEHSYSLKREVKNCKNINQIISTAANYGFNITTTDIEEDELIEEIAKWFEISEIHPIKKN